MVTRRDAGLAAAALVLEGAVLVPLALTRFIDGDEGVYGYAARLAAHGAVPYRDFFWGQGPLVPYVYGSWLRLGGESWDALRLLSAAFGLAAGVLLWAHVRRRLGVYAAFSALLLYTASALVFGYVTIVKTFALSALLLVAAYVLAEGAAWGASGVLLGLAIDTRLFLAALVPAFVLAALRARRGARLAAGVVLAVVPTVGAFALYPHEVFFGVVRYNSQRSSGGLVGDFHQKAQTAATLLGLEPTDRALGLQFAVLLVAAAAVCVSRRLRKRAGLALGIAFSLGAVSLLPTPTYVQYFCVAVPFLAVAAAELGAAVPRLVTLACLVLYLVPAAWAIRSFTTHDPLLRPSIGSVEQVARRVDATTSPGERVLSSWPGYLLGTHAAALADYTNQFAPVAAQKISASAAHRYHVASEATLERRLRARGPRVVVYRNWVTAPPFARWDAALRAGRYRLASTVETARIYVREKASSTIGP